MSSMLFQLKFWKAGQFGPSWFDTLAERVPFLHVLSLGRQTAHVTFSSEASKVFCFNSYWDDDDDDDDDADDPQ